MWINNKTVEWLDSMDLQDKNAKITQKKFKTTSISFATASIP